MQMKDIFINLLKQVQWHLRYWLQWGGSVTSNLTGNAAEGVKKAAAELMANKGAALVVCGSNDTNVQIIVNPINEAIGAGGKTIDWASTVNYRQGVDTDMATLTDDLNAGNVGALLIYGANPAYNFVAADKFKNGLKKCPVTISFNEKWMKLQSFVNIFFLLIIGLKAGVTPNRKPVLFL